MGDGSRSWRAGVPDDYVSAVDNREYLRSFIGVENGEKIS